VAFKGIKMKHIVVTLVLIVSIFATGFSDVFCQESVIKTNPEEEKVATLGDSAEALRLLNFELVWRDACENDSSLYRFWKSIEITDFSLPVSWRSDFACVSAYQSRNGNESLMDHYTKIDVSKSPNLDYKTLANKRPKSFDEEHPWGGLLLYTIFSSLYPTHGYVPPLNNK
jgi:hypothetical protein